MYKNADVSGNWKKTFANLAHWLVISFEFAIALKLFDHPPGENISRTFNHIEDRRRNYPDASWPNIRGNIDCKMKKEKTIRLEKSDP